MKHFQKSVKMKILTFEDGEDEILNHIMSYVSTGT